MAASKFVIEKLDGRVNFGLWQVNEGTHAGIKCQCKSESIPGKGKLNESKMGDLLHGSEYVLTYEDKDGNWLLVGDIPWEMFIESWQRLKIMKGSEATGLAPAEEKAQVKKRLVLIDGIAM